MEDILKRLRKDLEAAKEARENAQELIDLGKEADVDVSEQEARLTELGRKIDRLEEAIAKREE